MVLQIHNILFVVVYLKVYSLMLRLFRCKIFFIVKIFLDENDFRENNFFFHVWLHSKKCSEKYFTVLCER